MRISDWSSDVCSSDLADTSLQALAPVAAEFGRFNLLAWDGNDLVFASNHPGFASFPVEPGLHAMSNGAFDAPWPKSAHATRALEAWLRSPAASAPTDRKSTRLNSSH